MLINHRKLLWSDHCFCYCQNFELHFTRQYRQSTTNGTLVIWLFWSLPKFQITFYQTNSCVNELWKCCITVLILTDFQSVQQSQLQCLWVSHDGMRINVIRYELPLTLSLRLFSFVFFFSQQPLWFLKLQNKHDTIQNQRSKHFVQCKTKQHIL